MWVANQTDTEQLSSSVQTNVWTHMLCHFVFATEIGCLCEHDSLNFLSLRLIVCNCFCESCWFMSSVSCLIKPTSHRHSILEVSYSMTPLDAARVKNSILYLFCLSLSPWPLSLSLCLCLTLIPLLHYTLSFFSQNLDLSMERERHLVPFWKTESNWNRFVFGKTGFHHDHETIQTLGIIPKRWLVTLRLYTHWQNIK